VVPGAWVQRELWRGAPVGRWVAVTMPYLLGAAGTALVFGMVVWPEQTLDAPWWVKVGYLVIGLLPLWRVRRERQLRRAFAEKLAQCGYRVCPGCGYDLAGLPDPYTCPECGARFTLEGVAEFWKAWARGGIRRLSSGSADVVTSALEIAKEIAGGVPVEPVELTRPLWERSQWMRRRRRARWFGPPPARLWAELLRHVGGPGGASTLHSRGLPGEGEDHDVTLELVAVEKVRVTFRPHGGADTAQRG